MTALEIANKVAQRFLYGHIHHQQLSNFFKMLDLPYWAEELQEASIEDAKKRQKIDNFVIFELKRYPTYSTPIVEAVNQEFKNSGKEAIRQNEKLWLKRGLEEYCKYEQDTLNMLEMLHKEATNLNNPKLADIIHDSIDDTKEELDNIKSEKVELEKYGHDFDKFINDKGETIMPRYRDMYDGETEYRARGRRNYRDGRETREYRDNSEYRDGREYRDNNDNDREYRGSVHYEDGHHDGWHDAHEMMGDYPSYENVETRRRGRSSRTGRYTRR